MITQKNLGLLDEIPEQENLSTTPSNQINILADPANISSTDKHKVEWSPENEMILVEWCDIAQCYKWMNSRSYSKYSYMQAWYTIPAITLSTISGTASFAQTSLPEHLQVYAPIIIGTINIGIGILTTIQQYLKISELTEAHRVSSIAWDKFARNIRIELAKKPDERMQADHFMKLSRQEYDRMMETIPPISKDIVSEFMTKFGGDAKDHVKTKRFNALKKPDICDIIISAEETRHHWFKELPSPGTSMLSISQDSMNDLEKRIEADILKREEDLRIREHQIHDKEALAINREIIVKQMEENRKGEDNRRRNKQIADAELRVSMQMKKIDEFIVLFANTHGRRPINEEIDEHFKYVDNEHAVDTEILRAFLENYADDIV